MISIEQLAIWVIENRRDKAFKNYSFEKIVDELIYCCKNNSMLCMAENDHIVGLVCCEKYNDTKILFVHDVLTTKPNVLKSMLKFFMENYKGWIIQGINRNGRPREFNNIQKLTNRL